MVGCVEYSWWPATLSVWMSERLRWTGSGQPDRTRWGRPNTEKWFSEIQRGSTLSHDCLMTPFHTVSIQKEEYSEVPLSFLQRHWTHLWLWPDSCVVLLMWAVCIYLKGTAHPHRCFHFLWLIRPLLRLKVGIMWGLWTYTNKIKVSFVPPCQVQKK